MTNQYVDRTVDTINSSFCGDISFSEITATLSRQRLLHLDFDIGTDNNLLRGIHNAFLAVIRAGSIHFHVTSDELGAVPQLLNY
jgi:hypothetical protein